MSGMGAEHIDRAIQEPLLGVDTGDIRVGIAVKPKDVISAEPVCVLQFDADILGHITRIAKQYGAATVIVGLPRDINGNETAQTRKARHFAGELAEVSGLHIILHDEFSTSERARERLKNLSYRYDKVGLDAMAAAVLIDDYMESMVI